MQNEISKPPQNQEYYFLGIDYEQLMRADLWNMSTLVPRV